MGLELISCGKIVRISYSGWNIVRCAIVRAAIACAEEMLTKFDPEDKQNNEPMEAWLAKVSAVVDNDKLVGAVLASATSIGTRDMLNLHGLAGVVALCERYDCQGAYSPGQAMDVHLLLQLVTSHIGEHLGRCDALFHEQIAPLFQLAAEKRTAVLLF